MLKVILPVITALFVSACDTGVLGRSKSGDQSAAMRGCEIDSTAFNIHQQSFEPGNLSFIVQCRLVLRNGTEDTIYRHTTTPAGCPDTTMWKGVSYPITVGAHGPQCLLDNAD